MSGTRLEIGPGAPILAAVLLYLDQSGLLGPVMLFCLCHELGHCLAIRCLGGRVGLIRLTLTGAELRLSPARPLSPGRMALAALAGPLTNLLLAAGFIALARFGLGGRHYLLAGVNMGIAVFNLLPARRLDGGRILENGLAAMGREELGHKLITAAAPLAVLFLVLSGLFLFLESGGRSFTALLAGLWLAWTDKNGE